MRRGEVLLLSLIPTGILLIFLSLACPSPFDQLVVIVGAFLTFCPWGYVWGCFLRYLLKRFHFEPSGPANDDELLREDEVLMEATAFLQGIIFLYLSLIPGVTDSFATLLKWSVPIFGVLFYMFRAYARIKRSGKFRYYSIYVFLFMVYFDISAFIKSYTPHFYIANVNVWDFSLALIPVWIFNLLQFTLAEQAKTRYGLSKMPKQE